MERTTCRLILKCGAQFTIELSDSEIHEVREMKPEKHVIVTTMGHFVEREQIAAIVPNKIIMEEVV